MGRSAAEAFRADPRTAVFLPRVFEFVGFGTFLLHPYHWRDDLLALTVTGELDRRTLLDLCVGGLLRGGRATEPRGFWTLLEEAKPTDDELADHVPDWTALAGRSDPPVAGRAIEVLRKLLDAGRLDAGVLAEATRDVLSRPEKSLVRAQLKLVGEALRRAPADAGELLPAVAVAFGHEADGAAGHRLNEVVACGVATADRAQWPGVLDALPGLPARERRPRKLSSVLTLAADCAGHTGATGDVPGLDELADSKGSSQAVKQARRLRAGLAANAE